MKRNSIFFGKRLRTVLLLAFLSATLPSCIDITEEFWIHEDGTGRIKFEVGLAATMAAIADAGATGFEDAKAKVKVNPNVESFDFREETRDDMTYYIMDVTVKDISSLANTINDSMGDVKISPGGNIGLTRLENGNYTFVQLLDFKKDDDSGDAPNPFAAGMMAAMFQGRHMTIRVHGNIVSANGTIAEDGKSVEWRFPLTDAIAGRIDMKQAEAEISLERPGIKIDPKLVMIILGAIGVAVIAAIAFLLGKKSRA